MPEPSHSLSRRDRALAELVRARGWVDEETLQRALGPSDGLGLEDRLVISGSLTPEQARSLRDAVDGVDPGGDTLLRGSPAPPVAVRGRFGPYAVEAELGRGGAAVVYRARHATLGRAVALKVLRGEFAGEDTLERFRRETAVLARLGRHPGIVQIHEAGREGEALWFAMDLVEGRSLADRMRGGRPAPREAAEIAAAAAGALAAAHRAGVVHRDVKPQNILLDAAGRPYVADFGLARDTDRASGLTVTGDVFGTPAYMSPEQASGRTREAGAATDVWSLGVTLYEMLAGRQPFDAPNFQELLRRILEEEPPPIGSVHADLETVCLHALRKDPARRYPTAAEFEADLRRWLAGEPIHARSAGTLERWAARARRRPAIVAAAAVALLAAGTALGWAGWNARAARLEKERTQEASQARAARLARARADGEDLLARAEQARRLGELAERDRCLDRAATLLTASLAAEGPDPQLRHLLGRAFRLSGRPEEALREYEQAASLAGGHARASFEHGLIMQRRLFESLGEWDQRARMSSVSASVFEALILPVRASHDARRLPADELRRILAADFGAIRGEGVDADLRHYGDAILELLGGRHDEALAKLDAAIRENPNFEEALVTAGDLEFWRERYESGLRYRLRLLEMQPENPVARLEFAAFKAKTGRALWASQGANAEKEQVDEARRHTDIALAKLEDNEEGLLLAVNAAMMAGDHSGSVALARRLQRAAKTPERRRAAAVAAIAALSQPDPREALAALDESAAHFAPGEADAVRFTLLVRLRRHAEALAAWRALPEGWLRDSRLTEGLLEELRAGNFGRAAELEGGLSRVDPRRAAICRSLILLESGRAAEASAEFERSFKYEEFGSEADFAAPRIAWYNGRYSLAVRTLETGMGSLTPAGEAPTGAAAWIRSAAGMLTDASTPREAAAAMERLIGLTRLMVGADGLRPEFLEGLWHSLALLYGMMQDWRYAQGWPEESARDGEHFIRLSPCGLGCLRQARAFAAVAKEAEAVENLRKAAELGFEEWEWVDREKAFDGIRAGERFRECRGKMK